MWCRFARLRSGARAVMATACLAVARAPAFHRNVLLDSPQLRRENVVCSLAREGLKSLSSHSERPRPLERALIVVRDQCHDVLIARTRPLNRFNSPARWTAALAEGILSSWVFGELSWLTRWPGS